MAGQAMAGSFFQLICPILSAIYAHLVCVFVPKLNSGRLQLWLCKTAISEDYNPKFFLGGMPLDPQKTMLYTSSPQTQDPR